MKFGYARVSKKTKQVFQEFITDYFESRAQLVCAFVLIDIRLEAQKIDLEFIEYLGETEVPFCIIFTKAYSPALAPLICCSESGRWLLDATERIKFVDGALDDVFAFNAIFLLVDLLALEGAELLLCPLQPLAENSCLLDERCVSTIEVVDGR
jgi:hypothetical protein